MTILLVKTLRFPMDFVVLTLDFLTLTRWRLVRWIARTFGILGPHSGPLCDQRWRSQDQGGKDCALCGRGGRYANRFLFLLICPWAAPEAGGICICRRKSSYRLSTIRYSTVGALVLTTWLGLGYWLFSLSI